MVAETLTGAVKPRNRAELGLAELSLVPIHKEAGCHKIQATLGSSPQVIASLRMRT